VLVPAPEDWSLYPGFFLEGRLTNSRVLSFSAPLVFSAGQLIFQDALPSLDGEFFSEQLGRFSLLHNRARNNTGNRSSKRVIQREASFSSSSEGNKIEDLYGHLSVEMGSKNRNTPPLRFFLLQRPL